MFIAIVGTPSSGKRTVLEYLVQKHQFQEIKLDSPDAARDRAGQLEPPSVGSLTLSSSSTPLGTPALEAVSTPTESTTTTTFSDVPAMLDHTTKNWKQYLVTTDLKTFADIQPFVKRPFFMLLSVDGPLRTRFVREQLRAETASAGPLTLEQFVDQHDLLLNGPARSSRSSVASSSAAPLGKHFETDFKRVQSLATLSICNDLPDIPSLHSYLDELDLLNEERLRPGWDTYFMTLASLASHRSNCMKRRVGALLVRSKRILSTGYNGTAKGTRNCNEGGCSRCNGSARGGESLNECLCLHAEENALLEAGKDRIGEDSVIYCNTCPCLRCSVKIVQCGVREVVYNQSYSMDEASARVLKEAGVMLRQLHLPADMKAALL